LTEIITLNLDYIFYECNATLLSYQKKYSKNISKVILTGGGVLLKGFVDIAKMSFETEVIYANPFNKLETPAFLREEFAVAGPRISWLLSVRLCDYVRQKLGRNGQRMALTFARTGEDLRLLHRQRTYGESSQRIAEWEAEEVIEKLLSRLPGKRGLVMRCLLRHDFGPDGVKEAMRLAELSESRVSQIRMESVAMLREMGLDKVLKILC
jgi:cell division ATPase FtsA